MKITDTEKNQVTYETGAVRSADAEKTRYDLISPIGLRRVAETYYGGCEKYSDYNWEQGMPVADCLNHAIRHIYAYLSGDRSEDHLAHAAWNLLASMHSEELWKELNTNLRSEGCKPPPIQPKPEKTSPELEEKLRDCLRDGDWKVSFPATLNYAGPGVYLFTGQGYNRTPRWIDSKGNVCRIDGNSIYTMGNINGLVFKGVTSEYLCSSPFEFNQHFKDKYPDTAVDNIKSSPENTKVTPTS